MIHLDHLLQATNGVLQHPGKQQRFDAFSHDSRQLIPGEMFVAVRGEHGDGHDFLLDAIRRGATGLLIEERGGASPSEEAQTALAESGVATIVVRDTRIALQQYARAILQRWHPTVIAVTGSVGKTSTKEAVAAVLSTNFATFKSWQNYNDLLGLPLSLGRLEERHEYAVLELGCDHPGEISALCHIVQPQIGILTNVSPTQLQYFGTVERLAAELGSMFAFLPEDGTAIINEDDPYVRDLSAHARVRTMLPIKPSAVHSTHVTWDGLRCTLPLSEQESIQLTSRLLGVQHIATLLFACTVGRHCGIAPEEIQHTLAHLSPLPGRLNPLHGRYHSRLLDDTHNAPPASVQAGLAALKALPAGRRIAILGDMLNLGNFTEEAHRSMGRAAAKSADYLITCGEWAALSAETARQAGLYATHVIITSTHEDAAKAACQIIETPTHDTEDALLIKGSEGTRMERVTELLMARPEQAPEYLVRQTPGWKRIVVRRAERPTWVEIDLNAIANNTRRMKSLVGPDVRVLASLKADAYGHGALKVARTVLLNGASMLGVATVSEATPLREANIHAPILVFGYVPAWQMREAVRLDLTVTLYALDAAHALSRAAQALAKTVRVHVKIDTGMGRLGIRAEDGDEVLTLIREIKQLPGLELEGIFTHFATADAEDQTYARRQLARFHHVLQALKDGHLRPPLVHAANSAAAINLPEARFDMVRPGIALYGLDPSSDVRVPEGFRPALSFKTQVSQVKTIPANEGISYGITCITDRPTRIAVLPVGYADGFRRAPTNWGTVLIHGREAPILGRVCMDQCMIDVSAIPQARVGDEVVLIGTQGEAHLTAEQVARRLGTINYEVVAEILARVPRVD